MTDNNKYQININPKKPSKEEIRKKMDFEGAYKSYTSWIYRTPWHRFQRHAGKNRKISMMILLFAVIAFVLYLDSTEQHLNDDIQEKPNSAQIDTTNAPVKK